MSDIAIRVEKLGKMYRIGGPQERYKTLRDTIVNTLATPINRARDLLRGQAYGAAGLREEIWALKDISFEVKQGEVVGIIGSNGAGKSTLLKVLSRITEPTTGYVDVYGRVGSLLEVGTGFHPELTGRENIYLNGAILGMSRSDINRKFDEIVDFSGVEKFIDTPVKHFSSGMGLRLGFAVAAHLEPEILLVDEVLAVGDAQFQRKCLGKMGDVANEGRTVLFVSHNMIALRSLCPTAIWLDEGGLQKRGPSQDVVEDYLQLQAIDLHEQQWDDPSTAPGNETVRLHRVWVNAIGGSLETGITRETPVSIGVEYWHFNSAIQLHVTLHVYVEQQVIAFTTASVHDPTWVENARRPGLIRSICQIPANFLNTGLHRINVLVVQDRSKVIHKQEDALSFEVVETAGRTGAWYGKEPGVVRPQLPWVTEHLQSNVVDEISRQLQ